MKTKFYSHRTARTIVAAVAVAMVCLVATSCNKRCRCMRNDSSLVYYAPEQLESLGKSCSDMMYMEGLAAQYYSYCEWDY